MNQEASYKEEWGDLGTFHYCLDCECGKTFNNGLAGLLMRDDFSQYCFRCGWDTRNMSEADIIKFKEDFKRDVEEIRRRQS